MCAVDQLKFTERPPDSLSVLFPPRPSPVQLHGIARTAGSYAVGERLALAVRLARRDLHHSLAGRERFIPSVHMPVQKRPQVSSQCGFEPSQPPVEVRDEMSIESQAQACTRTGGGEEGRDGRDKKREGGGGRRREDRRGGDKRKEEDTELLCLKRALAQQVQRLQELCANEEDKVEQEDENERERRVAAEHVAAMARRLYDLQRQVLMSDGGGGDKGGGLQGKKLAAARRAATRTLHTFSSTYQSLPSQLLQLVGLLCGDRQSSELLALAQSYSDALTAARQNSLTPQQRMKPRAGIKPKGRRMAQRLNHIHAVSSPRGSGGLKTHFSEPTYSSSAKQQRTVLSSGTKMTSHSHRSSTAKATGRSGARRRKKAGEKRRERTGKEAAEMKGGLGSQKDSEGHKATQVTEAVGPDFSSPPAIPPSSPLPQSQSQCQSPTGSVQSVDTQGTQHSTGRGHSHSSLLPQGEMPHLVATLIRMEEEELMICKKWNQTPSPTVQHTRTRGHPRGDTQDHPNSDTKDHPNSDTKDHPRGDRGGQHVSGAHLEPWTPLENLADCLLEEAVCDVCLEMADACDSLANSLFFLEFQLPPTTSCS